MSINKTAIPANTSVIGLDKALSDINTKLDLAYLTRFGRVYKKDNNPVVREYGKAEYKSLTPSDSWLISTVKAYSFFYPTSDINIEDYQVGDYNNVFTRDIDFIFWGNLNKIYPTNPSLASENIINDILTKFKKANGFRITNIFDEPENVWSDFDINSESKFFQLPYYTFKISGQIAYNYKLDSGC